MIARILVRVEKVKIHPLESVYFQVRSLASREILDLLSRVCILLARVITLVLNYWSLVATSVCRIPLAMHTVCII